MTMRGVFLLIFLNSFTLPVFSGETVDVNAVLACDTVFQPSGCVGGRGDSGPHGTAWENLRYKTGIIVEPAYSGIDLGRVRRNFELAELRESGTQPRAGRQFNEVVDTRGSSISPQGQPGGGSDDPENPSENSDTAFDQTGGGSSPCSGGGGSSPQGNGQAVVAGGLLYSDDGPAAPSAPESMDSINPKLSPAPEIAGGQSAVSLNRQNNLAANKVNDPSSSDTGRGVSSVGSGGFGSFNRPSGISGGAVAPAGESDAGDGLIGRLGKIASGLGSKFFGLSGSGSDKNRASLRVATEAERLRQLAAVSKNDPNFRDLLRRQLAGQRGLASSLEFGSKESFLFGRVCQQYYKYAKENGIPDDRVSCPKN